MEHYQASARWGGHRPNDAETNFSTSPNDSDFVYNKGRPLPTLPGMASLGSEDGDTSVTWYDESGRKWRMSKRTRRTCILVLVGVTVLLVLSAVAAGTLYTVMETMAGETLRSSGISMVAICHYPVFQI